MNIAETALVLAKAASFDRRTIGDADVLAWWEALSDLDGPMCADAVTAHYRQTTDWLMPAHVRRHVAAELAARQGRINADRDAEIRRQIERVPTKDRSEDVAALLEELRRRLPDPGQDVLRRAEVVQWDRDRDRRLSVEGAEPNPAFRGWQPPPADVSIVEDAT